MRVHHLILRDDLVEKFGHPKENLLKTMTPAADIYTRM